MSSRLPLHRPAIWTVFSVIGKAIQARRRIVLPLLICITLLTLGSFCHSAAAQSSEWIWVGGSNSVGPSGLGQAGVYGTQGVASAANNPGSRESAATWTDSSGRLWLFGGLGFDSVGAQGYLNDLWELDPATLEWTWVGGPSTLGSSYIVQAGVYGTLGKAAAANIPGARLASVSWTDKSGNLWLFGGDGLDSTGLEGELNDLWEFSPTSREWTWMAGSSTVACYLCGEAGAYGVQGHAAPANLPGGRDSAVAWTDQKGNLWLFGGNGYDSTDTLALLNDLWEFDPTTSQWTWVSGSNTGGQTGVYGTLGATASTNVPCGRESGNSWLDENGNLWLFGGWGLNSVSQSQAGELNDLWEFTPANAEWTWMAGSSKLNAGGTYGTLGTGAAQNTPSSRNEAASWTDAKGVLWLFGGNGYGSTGGDLDDLWAFNPSTGYWTWVAGSSVNNKPGIYGTLNTLTVGNLPGSREAMALWNDNKGNAWIFGGLGYDAAGEIGYLNDLWEYRAPAAPPTFSPAPATYASAQSVTISDSTPGATIYYTTNGATPTTSSTKYTGAITVASDETIEAFAAAPNYPPSAVATAAYLIQAAKPVFTPGAGAYPATQSVTITDTTPGATIYYTTNGTTPTTSSTKYTGAIAVVSDETIEAFATAPDYVPSPVATAAYTIQAATPVIKPALGNFTAAQSVTITDSTPGAVIYYTTNGTTPTSSSTKYTTAISVVEDETIEAIAIAPNYSPSTVATVTFTIPAATPVLSLPAGNYTTAPTLTITDTTPNATIYYTTDGTTPTASSTKYTEAITVSTTETISAIAIAPNYAPSAVVAAKYIVGSTAPPVFSLKSGGYSSAQTVTITDATPGATIYYTVNGTTPTTSSTKYTGPISVVSDETIEALATAPGYNPSAVTKAVYTIAAAEPVVLSQVITITEATTGATVYYTTDGTTPTTASTKYTGPITLTGSEVLKFIAVATGYTSSPVRTVTDTVQ